MRVKVSVPRRRDDTNRLHLERVARMLVLGLSGDVAEKKKDHVKNKIVKTEAELSRILKSV